MRNPIALVLFASACSASDPAAPLIDPAESVAIQSSCAAPAPASSTDVHTAFDVIYSTPGAQPQALDVAWPLTEGVRPLVVLIHGGSWSGGSKTNLRADMLDLARRGYVAASVDYRLASAPRNIFPAAVRDVRCAVRWLRTGHGVYGIDTTRVAAAGFSAGGHLASMLGVDPENPTLDGDCAAANADASVDAVISYSGPQDLRVNGPHTATQASIVTNFLGVYPGDDPAIAALASPVVAVSPGDAAFLLIHGSRDLLVPPQQSRLMRTAVREAGGRATLLEMEGISHYFFGLGSSDRADVRCTSVAFLERWLGS